MKLKDGTSITGIFNEVKDTIYEKDDLLIISWVDNGVNKKAIRRVNVTEYIGKDTGSESAPELVYIDDNIATLATVLGELRNEFNNLPVKSHISSELSSPISVDSIREVCGYTINIKSNPALGLPTYDSTKYDKAFFRVTNISPLSVLQELFFYKDNKIAKPSHFYRIVSKSNTNPVTEWIPTSNESTKAMVDQIMELKTSYDIMITNLESYINQLRAGFNSEVPDIGNFSEGLYRVYINNKGFIYDTTEGTISRAGVTITQKGPNLFGVTNGVNCKIYKLK